MGQGDIATVTEQVSDMTPITDAENMSDNASLAGANISQTGSSIVNQTGKAAQTCVNKTASVLGNVTGEFTELFGTN